MIIDYTDDVIQDIKTFLGPENIDYLKLKFKDNKEKIILINTSLYNMCGMAIRNHIRDKFPQIDTDFNNAYGKDWYGYFEDWSMELIKKVILEETT